MLCLSYNSLFDGKADDKGQRMRVSRIALT